jgi:hypothetical protein
MTPDPMSWHDPFHIKTFAEHPGLLHVQAACGMDLLLDQYGSRNRLVCWLLTAQIVELLMPSAVK